jgi:hypothetical protein
LDLAASKCKLWNIHEKSRVWPNTFFYLNPLSPDFFSAELNLMKLAGMVELGVLMKFHYRTDFSNPVVLCQGGCKVGENSKVGSEDGFAI